MGASLIEVANATTLEQINAVRKLIRGFVAWHRERHHQHLDLIDQYFDADAFEHELATLPGKYAPPEGRLLLATYAGQSAGCVALREIDRQTCEMKRMFVYTQFQGKGVGRALSEALIGEARAAGYSRMRLDTGIKQIEAQRLYQSLGFQTIDPYYQVPGDLEGWLVFMELAL